MTSVLGARTRESIHEDVPTPEFIAWTLDRFETERLVLTTSFGMEGCALVDMYAALGVPLTVVYLDTMFFFDETYALRERMVERYPHLTFVNRGTRLTPQEQEARYGPALWTSDRDKCCELRKVEPMRAALADADVWVTAITRSQGEFRSAVPLVGWDWQFQVIKICPLARWDRARVWDYVQANEVPYNPLHVQGYPSIGCTHCTAPVPGVPITSYSRHGRWSGAEKTECGLHIGQQDRREERAE